jgi:hypothetical protein
VARGSGGATKPHTGDGLAPAVVVMHIKLRLRALGGFVADGYIESSTRGSGREAAGGRAGCGG